MFVVTSRTPKRKKSDDALRAHLLAQPIEWLVDQLLTASQAAPMLRARLDAGVSESPVVDAGKVDTGNILRRLDKAAEVGGYVHYRDAPTFVNRFQSELDAVDDLLAAGFAAAAVEVLEHAIHLIENLLESVDDSDGELGGTLAQAQLTHAEACEQANLDPAELAARLASWALHSDWEVFLESPTTHAEALGAEGLDTFEAVVDEHFAQLPQLRAGEDDERSQKPSRFTITELKKQLASRRGADALVEVLSRDLSIGYRYLGIATVLADDGREEEALQWLDRAQGQEFGGHPDTRLRDFAADLHRRTGHVDLATQLVADRFAAFPTVSTFDRLRDFATTSGDWPARRDAALRVLRSQPVAAGPAHRPAYGSGYGHSVLVEVLLDEDDVESAWQAAEHGGCSHEVWEKVATARGVLHPGDAMSVFQRLGERALEGGNRSGYQRGAVLIERAHRFAAAADLTPISAAWIVALREANRRRPALQNEFDRRKLPRAR